MYSVVVMMALTSGAETPDRHRGGSGCGCGGAAVASCGGGHQRHHGHRGHRGGSSCGSSCGASCGASYANCGAPCGGGVVYGGGCGTPVYGGGYGAPVYGAPAPYMGTPVPSGEPIRKMPAGGDKKTEAEPAEATIVVTLPEDARLLVDGTATTSTAGVRVLVSPVLEPGRAYHYTLQAEVVRDGKPVRVEERVAVRAGEETRVSLSLPAEGVALR